ncbi:hypothetical protein Pelo_14221 [Pelomyxa schiedti]|nr:hypothetical protein Pelo_14221 [Pelomyxa schiedti]
MKGAAVARSEQASTSLQQCKALVDEWCSSEDGWSEIPTDEPGVDRLSSRVHCSPGGKYEVYCTRARGVIKAPPKMVFDVYWNSEAKWNRTTVASIQVVEDGNPQLLYMQHKTLSATCPKRDVSFLRAHNYTNGADSFECWGASFEAPNIPINKTFCRGIMMFCGVQVSSIPDSAPPSSNVTYISCFDFTGWLHLKFTEAEKLYCATRLSRIREMAHSLVGVPIDPPPESRLKPHGLSSGLANTGGMAGDMYNNYLKMQRLSMTEGEPEGVDYYISPVKAPPKERETSPSPTPSTSHSGTSSTPTEPASPERHTPTPTPSTPATTSTTVNTSPPSTPLSTSASSSSVGTVLGCPTCQQAVNGRFCSNCGSKLVNCCNSCFSPAAGRFCSNCGNRLQ